MATTVTTSLTTYWSSLQATLYSADSASTGVVSASALGSVLASGDNAQELTNIADGDGSGTVSLAEFAEFANRFSTDTGLSLLSAQDIGKAVASVFAAIDTNGDGQVTTAELQKAATILSATLTSNTTAAALEEARSATTVATMTILATYDARISSIISSVDVNGDGFFSKSDVEAMLLKAMYGIGDDQSGTTQSLSWLNAFYGFTTASLSVTVSAGQTSQTSITTQTSST